MMKKLIIPLLITLAASVVSIITNARWDMIAVVWLICITAIVTAPKRAKK